MPADVITRDELLTLEAGDHRLDRAAGVVVGWKPRYGVRGDFLERASWETAEEAEGARANWEILRGAAEVFELWRTVSVDSNACSDMCRAAKEIGHQVVVIWDEATGGYRGFLQDSDPVLRSINSLGKGVPWREAMFYRVEFVATTNVAIGTTYEHAAALAVALAETK